MSENTWVTIGSKKYLVQGTPEALAPLAEKVGVKYDAMHQARPLSSNLNKVWGIGELADHIKDEASQ